MLMILFAWAANVSVLGCFIATVVPGILLVILLSIVQVVIYKKENGGVTEAIIKNAQIKEEIKSQ